MTVKEFSKEEVEGAFPSLPFWNNMNHWIPESSGIPYVMDPACFLQLRPHDLDSGERIYALADMGGFLPCHAAWEHLKDGIDRFYEHFSPVEIDQTNQARLTHEEPKHEPSPRRSRSGFVYIMQAGDLYKIGISKHPEKGRKSVLSPNDQEVSLLFSVERDDIYEMERALHGLLSDRRVKGEWFRLNEEIVSAVIAVLSETAL